MTRTSLTASLATSNVIGDQAMSDGPTILSIKRHAGIAGEYSLTAQVQYPGEDASPVTFVGSTYGGPIVMVMPAGQQVFVSQRVTDRIGGTLTPDCDRRVDGVLRQACDDRPGFSGVDFEGNDIRPIFGSDELEPGDCCCRCFEALRDDDVDPFDTDECAEFVEDGTCIHSAHMMRAGL